MLSSGSVKVRTDCIKLDVSEDVLLANADVRTRFLEKTSPIQRVRDTKIIFEEPVDDSVVTAKPISFSWNDRSIEGIMEYYKANTANAHSLNKKDPVKNGL